MCQEGLFTSVYRKRSQNAAFTVEGFKEDFFGSQQWFLSSSPVGPPQEQAWTWCRWQVWQSDRFSQGSDPRLRCRSAPVLMVQQQTRVKVSCKNASSAAVWSSPNEEDPLSLTSELPNVIVPPHGGGSRCSPTRVRRLMFINVLFKTVRFCAAASKASAPLHLPSLLMQVSTTKPPPSFWTAGEWSWSCGKKQDLHQSLQKWRKTLGDQYGKCSCFTQMNVFVLKEKFCVFFDWRQFVHKPQMRRCISIAEK